MKGLKESFWLIYSNTHLRTREKLPLTYANVGAGTSLSDPKIELDRKKSELFCVGGSNTEARSSSQQKFESDSTWIKIYICTGTGTYNFIIYFNITGTVPTGTKLGTHLFIPKHLTYFEAHATSITYICIFQAFDTTIFPIGKSKSGSALNWKAVSGFTLYQNAGSRSAQNTCRFPKHWFSNCYRHFVLMHR